MKGKKRIAVRGDGARGGGDTLHDTLEDAQRQVEFDRREAEDKLKRDEAFRRAQEQESKAEQEAIASYQGFDADKPMQFGKSRKFLEKQLNFTDMGIMSRKAAIERLVGEGWRVVEEKGEKYLERPDGRGNYGVSDLGSTGIRYAEYLISKKESETLATEQAAKPETGEKPQPASQSTKPLVIKQRLKNAVRFAPDTVIPEGVPFTEGKHPAFGDYIEVSTANVNRVPGYSENLVSEGDRNQATPETSDAQPAPEGKTEAFRALPAKSQAKFEELWNAGGTAIDDALSQGNKAYRAEFEARTGIKLPKTVKGTTEAVAKWDSEGRKLATDTATVPTEPPAPSRLLDDLESIEELRAVLENWSADDKRPKNSYSLKELIQLAKSRLQDFKLESGNELAEDLAGQNGLVARYCYNRLKAAVAHRYSLILRNLAS
jgi:hypothetical protein